MGKYIFNKETQKLELHFDKSEYMALDDEVKKEIKSTFLFSRSRGAWVSRAKFPNLYFAEKIAKKLELENGGSVGETLSFAAQMEQKAEKAERRAERYETYADNARQRGKALQKPINDMHGDTAFFTQPNINTSAGRAFTHKREKMFAAYEKGFDEFKKSEYFACKAKTARETGKQTRPTDKGFIDRRIKECEKTIRAQKANLDSYKRTLTRIENGEVVSRWDGSNITASDMNDLIEKVELLLENAISKWSYYNECMEAVGGVVFSKENIRPGYTVKIAPWGNCVVLSTGTKNFTYQVQSGVGCNPLKAAYAEISEVVSTEATLDKHPFEVGDTFTVKAWNGKEYADKDFTVTKVTDTRVTVKSGDERAVSKTPRKTYDGSWAISLASGLNGTVYKKGKAGMGNA